QWLKESRVRPCPRSDDVNGSDPYRLASCLRSLSVDLTQPYHALRYFPETGGCNIPASRHRQYYHPLSIHRHAGRNHADLQVENHGDAYRLQLAYVDRPNHSHEHLQPVYVIYVSR